VHSSLTARNILFDFDGCIQFIDFQVILLEVGEGEGENERKKGHNSEAFQGEDGQRRVIFRRLRQSFFEIVVGRPANDEISIPADIPEFVSRIIKSGLSPISGKSYSFNTILEILKQNDFETEDGVDSAEVLAFVRCVESAEDLEN
jgi:2-hydroxy-3-keto-5-methylthiopentenyl-1-phosphate phosphatase